MGKVWVAGSKCIPGEVLVNEDHTEEGNPGKKGGRRYL